MKKLNFIEMSTVYGGFDNEKGREVQQRGHELISEPLGTGHRAGGYRRLQAGRSWNTGVWNRFCHADVN